jgi:DnaJ-class molecular chaperone
MIEKEANTEVTDHTQGSVTCPSCKGTGISGAHVMCKECRGFGFTSSRKTTCQQCKGTGFSKPHVTCTHCRGFGSFPEK